MGVRSSWLTVAKNLLFIRFSASAWRRACSITSRSRFSLRCKINRRSVSASSSRIAAASSASSQVVCGCMRLSFTASIRLLRSTIHSSRSDCRVSEGICIRFLSRIASSSG
ncbi:hypothetical protein D3C80_1848240 [compost metagenome]